MARSNRPIPEVELYFVGESDPTFISDQEVAKVRTEDIVAKLMRRGNGGTTIRTNAAPAASTSFTKSRNTTHAAAGVDGYFVDISYPTYSDIAQVLKRKDIPEDIFGYENTYATAAYHQGFGEKSARALAREESIYQLKGAFPAATTNFTKLRARVEARGGAVEDLDEIFAATWGLSKTDVESIPNLVVVGSEATRLSALEDRAYHSLSGHPSHTGGYRVNLATIAPDALGPSVPLNWPRLRTTAKAIAMQLVNGDISIATILTERRKREVFRMGLDLVCDSQPQYIRGIAWESTLLAELTGIRSWREAVRNDNDDTGVSMSYSMRDFPRLAAQEAGSPILSDRVQRIASFVAQDSLKSLERTISVMMDFEHDRAAAAEQHLVECDELLNSELAHSFDIPRYKLTRSSVYKGITRESSSQMRLPDITASASAGPILNIREFREAGVSLQLSIDQALRLAVILTVQRVDIKRYVYMLLDILRVQRTSEVGKAAVILRDERLYNDTDIRKLGTYIFSDGFISTLSMIFNNISGGVHIPDGGLKRQIWGYLQGRTRNKTSECPPGGWKDLIHDLRDLPEGWTLYYWARISVGKMHNQLTSGIMAPVIAGSAADFLTMMKSAVKSRAQSWRTYYEGRYLNISKEIKETRLKRKMVKDTAENDEAAGRAPKYVVPRLRTQKDLSNILDESAILNRVAKYDKEQYEAMVKMQSKAKFFASMQVFTKGNQLIVGVSDKALLDMFIEFYQSRWYSIDRRVHAWKERGKLFTLGGEQITEHPWGELTEDFPSSLEEMVDFMESLPDIGWTISPALLNESFKKSINEMWNDITEEIATIIKYVEDVESGLAQLQDETCDLRPELEPSKALLGVPAITLPAVGYTPDFHRPSHRLSIMDKFAEEGSSVQLSIPNQAVVPGAQDDEEDLDELPGDDLDELPGSGGSIGIAIQLMSENSVPLASTLSVREARLLTYREIWERLGLPHESDDVMKMALSLQPTISVDDEHRDEENGPLVEASEVHLVERKWRKKLTFIRRRLGETHTETLDDDMRLGQQSVEFI